MSENIKKELNNKSRHVERFYEGGNSLDKCKL